MFEYNADHIKSVAARSCLLLNNISSKRTDMEHRASAIYQALSFGLREKEASKRMLKAASEANWFPFAITLDDTDIQNAELIGEGFKDFPDDLVCVAVQGILLAEMRAFEKQHDPRFLQFIKIYDAQCEESFTEH